MELDQLLEVLFTVQKSEADSSYIFSENVVLFTIVHFALEVPYPSTEKSKFL
jgi:hypothetical protein